MEILCCPMCRADLTLTPGDRDGVEIVTGSLTCTQCKTVYPIEDGIPNLLPPADRD